MALVAPPVAKKWVDFAVDGYTRFGDFFGARAIESYKYKPDGMYRRVNQEGYNIEISMIWSSGDESAEHVIEIEKRFFGHPRMGLAVPIGNKINLAVEKKGWPTEFKVTAGDGDVTSRVGKIHIVSYAEGVHQLSRYALDLTSDEAFQASLSNLKKI